MDQLFGAVERLNLASVKDRFLRMHPAKDAEEVERQYREFLIAAGVAKDPIALPESIDEFWHAHILDTRKYRKDCEELYGAFLHHDSSTHGASASHAKATSALLTHLFGGGDHWGLGNPEIKLALCLPTVDMELKSH